MKKSFKLFIGALVLTFFVSQNLFAESRCQTFFKEMLNQDISSDVFNPAITPIQSIGFGKKKYFDKDKYYELNPDVKESGMDAWEHYKSFGIKEGRAIR